MKHDGMYWHFASGRKRYAYSERLAIDFDDDGMPSVTYGHDGTLWNGFEWDLADEKLTREDLLEVATVQIEQWQKSPEAKPEGESP